MERPLTMRDLRLGLVRLSADQCQQVRTRVVPILAATTLRLRQESQTSPPTRDGERQP